MSPLPSKKAIDRAGTTLRDWFHGRIGGDLEEAHLRDAVAMLFDFRARHSTPLNKTTVGVRQFVQRESSAVVIAQRLKRAPTILDKLGRHPTMKLTRMQDIAGCRAVLANHDEVEGVLRRIRRNWDVRSIDDYVNAPKSTGYRAHHVTVIRDHHLVEIQLRTLREHRWAMAVEQVAGYGGPFDGLKDGLGNETAVRFFHRAGELVEVQDRGASVDKGLRAETSALAVDLNKLIAAHRKGAPEE